MEADQGLLQGLKVDVRYRAMRHVCCEASVKLGATPASRAPRLTLPVRSRTPLCNLLTTKAPGALQHDLYRPPAPLSDSSAGVSLGRGAGTHHIAPRVLLIAPIALPPRRHTAPASSGARCCTGVPTVHNMLSRFQPAAVRIHHSLHEALDCSTCRCPTAAQTAFTATVCCTTQCMAVQEGQLQLHALLLQPVCSRVHQQMQQRRRQQYQ